jgi:hypothetical protein
MDCLGGPLGYADIYHLQRGITVWGTGGKVYTPSLLRGDGSHLVGYRSRISPLMLRCLEHASDDPQASLDWMPVRVSDVEATVDLRRTCSHPRCGVNVLENRCPGGTCYHPVGEHSVYGCAEGCGCEWMPGKKPDPEPQDNHDWHHHTPSSGLTCRACDLAHKFWTGEPCPHAAQTSDKARNPEFCTCTHPKADHSPALFQHCQRCGCLRFRDAPKPLPCSDPPCGYMEGELCDTHTTEKAHAEGDHQWCDITCQDNLTWEMLRNGILWRAAPGSPRMLDELLRRAADRSALMEAHIAVVRLLGEVRAQLHSSETELNELKYRMEGLEK